jgi:orotate phosphoribosyltransferase
VLPSQPTTEPMVTRRRGHVPAAERAVMNVTVAVASESGMCCCAFSPARRAGARPSSAEACGPDGRDVEDLVSSGSTNLLIELVEQLGAQVVGVGCLWRRTSVEVDGKPVFSLVSRELSYL